MAYTIGASHGPFTGAGNFVVSKPAGIRTVLTGIPLHTGHDGGSPRRYFKLGRFAMGNIDGFQFSHGLEYAQQLLYPMPPVWEILAYDVKDGASCLFQELVDVPDLSLKQPWDRTAVQVTLSSLVTTAGAVGSTIGFSYTVPAGRKLLLSKASVAISRATAATTPLYTNGSVSTTSGFQSLAILRANTVGASVADDIRGGPVLVNAGQSVTGTYSSTDTGGTVDIQLFASGVLFDA